MSADPSPAVPPAGRRKKREQGQGGSTTGPRQNRRGAHQKGSRPSTTSSSLKNRRSRRRRVSESTGVDDPTRCPRSTAEEGPAPMLSEREPSGGWRRGSAAHLVRSPGPCQHPHVLVPGVRAAGHGLHSGESSLHAGGLLLPTEMEEVILIRLLCAIRLLGPKSAQAPSSAPPAQNGLLHDTHRPDNFFVLPSNSASPDVRLKVEMAHRVKKSRRQPDIRKISINPASPLLINNLPRLNRIEA